MFTFWKLDNVFNKEQQVYEKEPEPIIEAAASPQDLMADFMMKPKKSGDQLMNAMKNPMQSMMKTASKAPETY
eukprot:UN07643